MNLTGERKCFSLSAVVVLVVGTMLSAKAEDGGKSNLTGAFSSAFYKDWPLFSTRPDETLAESSIDRFGPVGIGIHLLQPAFVMKIKNVEKGSPAEATGQLKPGQIIETINGQTLKDIDPRIQLGGIITQAEATDGKVTFKVKDTPEASAQDVVVQIPVLGAYSKTWPLNCPKSAKIVRGVADYLAKNSTGGFGTDQGLLFLLSTGEEKDLEVARGWVKDIVAKNKDADISGMYPWYIGYGAPALCEYYLKTGDESVLPIIDKVSAQATRTMYNSGWNQKTGANIGYGHMNAAGVHCVKFLLLARECGAKVDEYTLQESLKHMIRYAGHGNTPYGDHLPESGFVDNGKVGGLAFAMAAAVSLTLDGEKSVYAKARDISAIKSFYSTSWMLHGHTGGGIGEIWRSSAMGLLYDRQPVKYREFMDNRMWHYELSRRFDGSIGILGGGSYDVPSWGVGYAMTYTVPRKTLRMTGAPPTRFSKPYKLPARPWGTAADEDFFSLTPATDRTGKTQDVGVEKLATDASWPIHRRLSDTNVTDEVLMMYARHLDQGVREGAAGAIYNQKRDHLIVDLLKDKDPRVRHVGTMAINSFAPSKKKEDESARMTGEMVPLLIGMVNNPDESWWVVRSALSALGMAKKEDLAPHVDRLCTWLQHEEWWLQTAALTALSKLVVDEQYCRKILPLVGKIMSTNRILPLQYALAGVVTPLQDAKPELQAEGLRVLSQAYAEYPTTMKAPGGMDMNDAQGVLLDVISGAMAAIPSGYDELFSLAKKRRPNQSLPHKDLFFNADTAKLGPVLKSSLNAAIRDQLIPEYIANNCEPLLAEVRPEPVVAKPQQFAKVEELVALYAKMGVADYDWHDFGPVWTEMQWDYFTFDPPEAMPWSPGQTRYRKVTYPAGMENWFANDFDAKKAGWLTGLQPFGQENGKLRTEPKPFFDQLIDRPPNERKPCTDSFCRCCEPMKTFWEKEVLLMRGTFAIPQFKEGHRYRLVIGGLSNMNNGDGIRIYVNGKVVLEREREFKKREGGVPVAFYIDQEHLAEFQRGTVTIAGTGFLHIHLRSKNKGNFMAIWLQEMKMPPLDQEIVRNAATIKSMLCAGWQALQNPEEAEGDPEVGKFRWDGKFVANQTVMGAWTQLGQVATIDEFKPGAPIKSNKGWPLQSVEFRANGLTGDPLWIWTGDTLMGLAKCEALKMTVKVVDGTDYLFIEAGGFNAKAGKDWKSPLYVMKRAGEMK